MLDFAKKYDYIPLHTEGQKITVKIKTTGFAGGFDFQEFTDR